MRFLAVTEDPYDRAMTAWDQERLRHARMMGAASGMKGVVDKDLERATLMRAAWPELWERVEQVTSLIDWR